MLFCQFFLKLITLPAITTTTGIALVFLFAEMTNRIFPGKISQNTFRATQAWRKIITAMISLSLITVIIIFLIIIFDFKEANQCHDTKSMLAMLSIPLFVAYMGLVAQKIKTYCPELLVALGFPIIVILIITFLVDFGLI